MRITVLALVTVLLGCELMLAGCTKAKPPANTPEAVAQAFADAMAEGDAKTAAELWDFVAEARKGNSDWDEIPSGQRQQIISKMRAAKAEELQGQTGLFGAGLKAGTPSTSGTTATVQLEGGAQGSVSIFLTQSDGKWGVSGFASVVSG